MTDPLATRSRRKKDKPTCDECGGPMERMAYGGEMPGPNGKWVKCNRESWVCKAARDQWAAERARAVALIDTDLRERFGEHGRWIEYAVIEEV